MKAWFDSARKGLKKRSRLTLTTLALSMAVLVGLLDWLVGREISASVFYLLPIIIATWYAGAMCGLITALSSGLIWLAAEVAMSDLLPHPLILFWNSLVRIGFFVVVLVLVAELRRLTSNLRAEVETKTAELESELQERLRLETELAIVNDLERQSIAHNLHDDLGQHLTSIAFKLKTLAHKLRGRADPASGDVEQVVQLVNAANSQARRLARGLDPIEVEGHGLVSALHDLAAEATDMYSIPCFFRTDSPSVSLRSEMASQLYRIAQEAITNAVKHGKPQRIEIHLNVSEPQLRLTIVDNGIGFHPDTSSRPGMGLRTMRHRARSLGGHLEVDSQLNQGTKLMCVIPDLRSIRPPLLPKPLDR